MKRRVVISGTGVICCLGKDTEETWQNCLSEHAVVEPIPEAWKQYSDYKSNVWAPLPKLDFTKKGLTRIETLQNDPFTLLATCAAFESLADAKLDLVQQSKRHNTFTILGVESERTGIFLGTGIGGANTFLSNHSHQVLFEQINQLSMLQGTRPLSNETNELARIVKNLPHPLRFNPFVVSMLMPNAAAANLGIKFGITGPNLTFSVACSASTVAIGNAYRAIQSGQIEMAIAGGAEYLYDEYGGIFRGFDAANTLTHGHSNTATCNRPFDTRRSGFLFSEGGAAILVLEEYEHARRRGARIVAEIVGFAESFDAHNLMSIAPDGKQIERMLRNVLEDACVSSSDVDLVNAHGTGTMKNDAIESDVIDRVFVHRPHVTATKSLTGHLIGASGAVETVITALSLKHQLTHPCKNLENPVANLNFVTTTMSLPIRIALTQSFAFGGHNSVLALARTVEPAYDTDR